MNTRNLSSESSDALADLEAAVRSLLQNQVRRFRIALAAGGVVLHGLARTYYAKQLAQHAVMKATAVPIVGNHICVQQE